MDSLAKKPNGALIGSIVIVVILVLGGIYMWQSKVKSEKARMEYEAKNVLPADSTEVESLEEEVSALDTSIDLGLEDLQ